MQQFNIEILMDEFMLKPEMLANKYGFRIATSGKIKRVNTAPSVIYFADGKFTGSFIYDDDELRRIILIPIIENVHVPNYPCEEYQKIKQQYCIEKLKTLCGDDYSLVEGGMQWETDKYFIGSYVVTHGKDKFTDGNITINMRLAE